MACPARCTRQMARPGPELDHTWTASNLVALGHTHSLRIQEFNCVESAQDPPADAAAANDVDERDGDGLRPAAPLPLPPLNKLASQLPRKMKIQSCWNSAASPRRSCAMGSSTRPSRTGRPVRKCSARTGPRSLMPSPAPRRATWATQSYSRTCLMTRTITASQTRGGNFDTHLLRGSRASTSLAHGRWRSANLHGRRGSAST